MKYLVKTNCLDWYTVGFIVDADSKEDAVTLVKEGEGDICYSKYDGTDQIHIKEVKLYEN